MKTILAMGAAALLAGCMGSTTPMATEIKTVIQKVPVRAACPAPDVYAKLKADRPTPLRLQPMPGTAQERTALTQAQLGRFEASGAWADRAERALDRCQEAEDLTAAP